VTSAAAIHRAISEAAQALAHRMYERDQLPEDERPEPRAFALDYLNAMVGHGWRPTNAQRIPWVSKPLRDNSETNKRGAELARQSLPRKSDAEKEGYHDAGPV